MAKLPTKIGKYKIVSQIGEGGMGAVYKAIHPTLNRTIIIKKLTLTGSQDFEKRFKREAQIMMDFRNENIVQVYDHFKEGNAYHIVMEYVDGITLEDLIQKKRFLSNESAILIFSEICKALKYAHDRLVIHRDIKPANILISKSGMVKLVDFGVSATLEESDEDGLTKAGMTIGTPSYLAPEQISNARNRDKRTDIYSMGVMLYEMVIGKKPFRGGFTPEVIAMIEKGKYLLPRKINPKIKPFIQKIIKKSMHHKVRKRYQDLGYILAKLAKHLKKYKSQNDINSSIKLYLDGKDNINGKKKAEKVQKFSSNIAVYLVTVVAVCGIICGGVFWAWQQGYHYEYLYPDQYGAFRVVVKIKKGHKALDEHYIKAVLYSENKDKLRKLDLSFNFEGKKQKKTKSRYVFESQKIYLKERTYFLLLYVENEQYRESFYLSPRQLQRLKYNTSESQKIVFAIDKLPQKFPVRMHYMVAAIHTGEDITQNTEISLNTGGRWADWNELIKGKEKKEILQSGKRYRFRFRHDEYYTKYYNITIQPEQTALTINLNMTPVPGTLFLKSDSDSVQAQLDNSLYYISGKRNRKYKKLKPLSSKFQKIYLSPGTYFLTAKNKKMLFGSTSSTKKILIQSDQEVRVTFSTNQEDRSVLFNIE